LNNLVKEKFMSLLNRIVALSALSLSLAIAAPASANLIQNGSFEDDVIPGNSWQSFTDITGWEADDNNERFEIWNNYNGETAAEGNQFAELNAHPGSTLPFSIFQEFTTATNQSYDISFAYQARANDQEKFSFDVISGSDNLDWLLSDHTTNGWRIFSESFVAAGTTTKIMFTSVNPLTGTVGNFLDDVRVTATVPEPGTLGLLSAGLIGLVAVRRRRA
jgi:hypothetical protein